MHRAAITSRSSDGKARRLKRSLFSYSARSRPILGMGSVTIFLCSKGQKAGGRFRALYQLPMNAKGRCQQHLLQ